MKYLSVKETAEKWGISERRVRLLAGTDRVSGVIKQGKSYLIPENAEKPIDKRFGAPKTRLYLKWGNSVIGLIDEGFNVIFTAPEFNEVVARYTNGKTYWTRAEFEEFLSDRIISPKRRDIEHILFKLGFTHYSVMDVALTTHAINSSDLLWIAFNENDKLKDAFTEVFRSVFVSKKDLEGASVDSPEGYNIKRYGAYKGRYGIFKNRMNPLAKDIESEIAVYGIAKLIGVDCCPAYRVDEDTVFSEFLYDISREYIVHFRHFFDGPRGEDEYYNLLSVRPQYQKQIIQMIILDFLTRQDDRHLSNVAVKISGGIETFYPLYDNGRSLFYEDTPETAEKAAADIKTFSTGFGPSGTYYDILKEISESGVDFKRLVKLGFTKTEVKTILKDAGFEDYRLKAAADWIMGAAKILKNM